MEGEIKRINTYFEGAFKVYKIPPWMEIAPANTKVNKIYHINYLLQTEEDTKKTITNADGKIIPILAGLPYYPFATKRKAISCFEKLTSEEKNRYIIISQSIIYIGHCSEENRKKIEEVINVINNPTTTGQIY